ncbi:MAG: hypothetical protein CUN57_03470, partial [Phototrophicales bacterium]
FFQFDSANINGTAVETVSVGNFIALFGKPNGSNLTQVTVDQDGETVEKGSFTALKTMTNARSRLETALGYFSAQRVNTSLQDGVGLKTIITYETSASETVSTYYFGFQYDGQ